MYQKGMGVSQDYQEAFKWYQIQRVKDQGRSYAQNKLGLYGRKRIGLGRDYQKAVSMVSASSQNQGDTR